MDPGAPARPQALATPQYPESTLGEIEAAFDHLCGQLVVEANCQHDYEHLRRDVLHALRSKFRVKGSYLVGSCANGTSVGQHHVSDVMILMGTSSLTAGSGPTIRKINAALRDEKMLAVDSHIGIDRVYVARGGRSVLSLIPADDVEDASGYDVYEIPGGEGPWIRAAPLAHKDFIEFTDVQTGGRYRRVLLIVKLLLRQRRIPVSAYFVELTLASIWVPNRLQSYASHIHEIVSQLVQTEVGPRPDPLGVSPSVRACASLDRRLDAMRKLTLALDLAGKAVESELSGNIGESLTLWRALFNHSLTTAGTG